MTFKPLQQPLIGLLVILSIVAVGGRSSVAIVAGEPDVPRVQIVSPNHGYVVGAAGSRKLLVCLEITDTAGTGIFKTNSGVPRFIEPNRNVGAFLDGLVARSSYTNKLGQEVEQYVAMIPVDKLRTTAEFTMTPPIDFRKIRPDEGEKVMDVPLDAMVQAVTFNFQVQDLSGGKSDPDSGKLTVGLAPAVWMPPELPAPSPLTPKTPS